jgi:succinyl-diaminopimelate desuccinylase
MKGGIASALAALSAIRRSGVELAGRLDLHLAADEELAGLHGTQVLLERGYLDQDAAIVGEPTDLNLALAERGGAWITATAGGKAAHGSTPQLGINAITSMARFLLRIEEVLPDLEHPLVGRPSVNAAMIQGGIAPNVVADRCVVEIDRRIVPGETDPEEVLEPFERLADEIRAEHAEVTGEPAIAELCRVAVREETGRARLDTGITGITDARFYLNDRSIPTIILGPGSISVAHTANESVEIAQLVSAARVYARVFTRFLDGS